MTILRLVISGQRAAEAAHELQEVLGTDVPIERTTPSALSEVERKAIDPISLAALILAIPGAVLATVDLADRIAKRRRAKALVDTAQRLRREKQVEVYITRIDTPKALADLSPDEVLALAPNGKPTT